MLALEWRPRAQLDRESIALYLGMGRSSPDTALKTIRSIDEAIDRAREFPDSGSTLRIDDLEHKEYRFVMAGKHLIYYRHDAKTLTVYRIIHQRRDIDAFTFVDLP